MRRDPPIFRWLHNKGRGWYFSGVFCQDRYGVFYWTSSGRDMEPTYRGRDVGYMRLFGEMVGGLDGLEFLT